MGTAYREDELESLLVSHLAAQGFHVELERIIDDRVQWRPPIFAKLDEDEFAIDIRLTDNITAFWLATYKKTYEICPRLKVFVAIPEDVTIPFTLGKKLEEYNVGIIHVSYDGINYLLEPSSYAERETAKAIRKKIDAHIDRTTYDCFEPYVSEIEAAITILEIGYPREAIGAIGRVLETAIHNFLVEANKRHRIALSERRRETMDFDTKIRFLASDSRPGGKKRTPVITHSEEAKMLSVKWDRNIGDHPADDVEIRQLIQDSRAILELGINMIGLMKKKREELCSLDR